MPYHELLARGERSSNMFMFVFCLRGLARLLPSTSVQGAGVYATLCAVKGCQRVIRRERGPAVYEYLLC